MRIGSEAERSGISGSILIAKSSAKNVKCYEMQRIMSHVSVMSHVNGVVCAQKYLARDFVFGLPGSLFLFFCHSGPVILANSLSRSCSSEVAPRAKRGLGLAWVS